MFPPSKPLPSANGPAGSSYPESGLSEAEGDRLDLVGRPSRAQVLDRAFTWVVQLVALSVVGVLMWMGWEILTAALPALAAFGLPFLWSQEWDIGLLEFGALPYIYGTIVTSGMALLLAVPIGLAVAVLTCESILPLWVRSPLAFLVELIAAIPSVIIGLWGIFILIPILDPLQLWLHDALNWVPLFSTPPYGPGMFAAGIVLTIMILPTMAAISRDVLLALPGDLRSASRALGATRWETLWTITLPTGSAGILGAITLALGRALGETMAVTMVIGNVPVISASLLELGYTIPAVLANEFAEAYDELHVAALMYLALILFMITLLINGVAALIVKQLGQAHFKEFVAR